MADDKFACCPKCGELGKIVPLIHQPDDPDRHGTCEEHGTFRVDDVDRGIIVLVS